MEFFENVWRHALRHRAVSQRSFWLVTDGTVRNILKEHGYDPDPRRGDGTWSEFLKIHAKTLWACDFLTKKVWTTIGLVDYFVLFFIHVDTRKVYVAGITANPDDAWMAQQARNLCMVSDDWPDKPQYIVCDQDTKFTAHFEELLKQDGIKLKRTAVRAPNQNAYAERWVQTIQQECLDHFVVLGEEHLRYLVREFVEHYNKERPHQNKGNLPLGIEKPPEIGNESGQVVFDERLGGLLKHYYRKAG